MEDFRLEVSLVKEVTIDVGFNSYFKKYKVIFWVIILVFELLWESSS